MQKCEKYGHSAFQAKTTPIGNSKTLTFEQLQQMDRQVVNIRTYLGGELARSSEFCDLLVKDYQCGLQEQVDTLPG